MTHSRNYCSQCDSANAHADMQANLLSGEIHFRICQVNAHELSSMGTALSCVLRRLCRAKMTRILMVGLDAAGKTTILYKFKLGEVVTTIPTIGRPYFLIIER